MIRSKAVALAIAVAMFVSPAASVAGDCRAVYRPAVVQQQVIVPSYSQSFSTYGHNTIVVPKAFAVEVLPQYYAAVSDDYRQLEFAKLLAQELAKIAEANRQLSQPQPAPAPSAPVAPVDPIPPAKDLPPAGKLAPPPGQALRQQSKIGIVLATRCAGCHDSKSKTSHPLDGDPDKVPEVDRLRAFLSVSVGKMPKGKPPVSNDELNTIAEWAGAK